MLPPVGPEHRKYEPIEGESLPLKFFVRDEDSNYKILGLIPFKTRLFGVESSQPDARVYLLGADSTGRDVFSRLLYGARVSLSIGFVGIAITMVLGFLVGGLAGYFGGAFDFIAMRFVEFLMAIPSLYLLLAMRSALAPHFDSAQMYIMIVIILSALGWAGTARVIRGMSLSLANTQYVQAAKAMGESPVNHSEAFPSECPQLPDCSGDPIDSSICPRRSGAVVFGARHSRAFRILGAYARTGSKRHKSAYARVLVDADPWHRNIRNSSLLQHSRGHTPRHRRPEKGLAPQCAMSPIFRRHFDLPRI